MRGWARAVAMLAWLAACASAAAAPVLYVEDRDELTRLEDVGYAFEDLFDAAGADNLELLSAEAPAYRSIVDTISADLGELRGEINAGGRTLSEFTTVETGRIMDLRWLTSYAARYRLVGIVNRLDRRDFHGVRGEATCGEVRLVYRLAYAFRKDGTGKVLSSRMPFNFNAVFDVPLDDDGGCADALARWEPSEGNAITASWLASGPLAGGSLRLRQLELNAQVIRFPSGQEPAFGGQAVYLMRIFGIDGEAVTALPLENTPDPAKLAADAQMKARLVDYVRANASAVDQGVYQLPDEFLATKLVSWSTFGGARPVNHPFSTVLTPEDFDGIDFAGNRLVRTADALIARLDNGTCQGCHQAGSTAGFHVIGLDDGATSPLNRILVGVSPHFHAEQPRREAYAAAMLEGRRPDRFRPLSFAPPAQWGDDEQVYEPAGAAMQCLTPEDAEAMGGGWDCAAGTQCTTLAQTGGTRLKVAQCLVSDEAEMFSGHPCLSGEVTASAALPFNDGYDLDQFTAFAAKASPWDYTCRPPRIGVPGGMAYRQCHEKDRAFEAFTADGPMPREICGLTGGKQFDICVSSGNFDQCLAGVIQRGNRAACSADNFCRDDYMCQAFPADTPNVRKLSGVGFCSPTYFVFQMRIDNHTTPWRSRSRSVYRSMDIDTGEDPDDWW
jgi:hypothetical protein